MTKGAQVDWSNCKTAKKEGGNNLRNCHALKGVNIGRKPTLAILSHYFINYVFHVISSAFQFMQPSSVNLCQISIWLLFLLICIITKLISYLAGFSTMVANLDPVPFKFESKAFLLGSQPNLRTAGQRRNIPRGSSFLTFQMWLHFIIPRWPSQTWILHLLLSCSKTSDSRRKVQPSLKERQRTKYRMSLQDCYPSE